MDGPHVNLSFHKELETYLRNTLKKTIINIGTCSLHQVHTAFMKGLSCINFDFDQFAQDCHFFFKYSAARREDFRLASQFTGTEVKNILRHVPTRWLSLKLVLTRILSQWENLKQYFLKDLPKQSRFKYEIEKTERYKRLKAVLSDESAKIYISFAIQLAQSVEFFLLLFQSEESKIHLLYSSFTELFTNILSRFVKTDHLKTDGRPKDALELSKLDLSQVSFHIELHKIDIGAVTEKFILSSKRSDREKLIMRHEFKKCYIEFFSYLVKKFPLASNLKDLQCFHPAPEFRLKPENVQAVQRVAVWLGTALEANLFSYFNLRTDMSVGSFSDLVKEQYLKYQNEAIPDTWFIDENSRKYRPIDHYWNQVAGKRNEAGIFSYQQLCQLALAALSISHSNATPERGFSVNKNLLDDRSSLKEDTIVAIRQVKHCITAPSEIPSFVVTRDLLNLASVAHRKYVTVLETQKKEEKEKLNEAMYMKTREQMERKKEDLKRKLHEQINILEDELKTKEAELRVAQGLIEEANNKLKKFSGKSALVKKNQITDVQIMLELGIERSTSVKTEISKLETKLKELHLKASASETSRNQNSPKNCKRK